MKVAAGMKREEANALINRIYARAEQLAPSEAPDMMAFSEVYDLKTVEPKQDLVDNIERATEILVGLGVPFS
jgi:hypothetical protein